MPYDHYPAKDTFSSFMYADTILMHRIRYLFGMHQDRFNALIIDVFSNLANTKSNLINSLPTGYQQVSVHSFKIIEQNVLMFSLQRFSQGR